MKQKLKAAIIGTGMIANAAHIPAIRNLSEDTVIAAICGLPEEAAYATAKRFNIPTVYTDAEKMLKEQEPDIVAVCTPNVLHKPMTQLALQNGAHVICEKPVALSYHDAVELYDIASSNNRLLVACQTIRYKPEHMIAKELVSGGILGNIYFAELSRIRRRGLPAWGSFHNIAANGGGAFCDIGVHLIDSILWIMGNPKMVAVCGSSNNLIAKSGEKLVFSVEEAGAPVGRFESETSYTPAEFNVEEFGAGTIRLEGGCMLNFKVAWAANLPNKMELNIIGDKAGICIPDLNIISSIGRYQADTQPRWFNEGRYKDKAFSGHWYLWENVVNAIRGKEELMIKPAETLNVSAIIDAFYISANEGREVTFKELQSR